MKGDFSRNTFNPKQHYRSVLKQQGRVDIDADWNEQQAIHLHRIETEANDIIGGCGAPKYDAGFHIVTDVTKLTDEEKILLGNQNPPKLTAASDFLISAGRFYVDGILCENEQIATYTTQPDLPGAQAIVAPGFYVVYLAVWQRHITALDNPLIREKALGGPDTATRVKTIWQVKVLPVASARFDPQPVKAVLKELRTVMHLMANDFPIAAEAVKSLEANTTAFMEATGAGNLAQSLQNTNNIHSLLQKLELPPQVVPSFGAKIAGIKGNLGKLLEGVGKITCDSQLDEWKSIIRNGTGRLNARTQPPDPTEQACLLPPSAGYQRLENQLYRVEIHKVNKDGTPISFVWSRDNGTVVMAIKSISGNNVVVSDVGPDDVLGFTNGQWVEIIDDKIELNGLPGQLLQISNVEEATRTITMMPTSAIAAVDMKAHPKVRRWDQARDTATQEGVPITFAWQPLEAGIEVNFTKGTYKPGDYWLIPARTATGEIEWPPYEIPNSSPLPQPPTGIEHHYCRLALVRFDGKSITIQDDCRKIFSPLTELHSDSQPGIQIVKLLVNDRPLLNDTDVPVGEFINGIKVICSKNIAQNSVENRPTCFVTLQMPFPFNAADRELWGNSIVGFQPLILAGLVKASNNTISWVPAKATEVWLMERLFQMMNESKRGDRILMRLTLQGNYIWNDQNPDLFLDGEAFGIKDPATGQTRLRLPSGNGLRGGDFDMWFWLMPPPPPRLINLTLDPASITLKGLSKGTVQLDRVAPVNGVVVSLSSDQQQAKVPASGYVTVPEGSTSATFPVHVASSAGVVDIQANINASFGGVTKSAVLTITSRPLPIP